MGWLDNSVHLILWLLFYYFTDMQLETIDKISAMQLKLQDSDSGMVYLAVSIMSNTGKFAYIQIFCKDGGRNPHL